MALRWADAVTEQRRNLPVLATTANCRGGTFIVTGANIGLGYETIKHLIQLKPTKVILACRNPTAGETAKHEIESATNCHGLAEVWALDLSSFASVKAFAARAVKELDRIDGLVENAGVALDKWSMAEGHETSVTVNIMSTFLLAIMLLPKMSESAKRFGITPHVVIVSSGAAFMLDKGALERIEGDVFGGMDDEGKSDMIQRYQLSKLVQIHAFLYFATLVPSSRTGVVMTIMSPGLFKSALSRHARFAMRAQVTVANMLLGRTAEMSSRSVLHGLVVGKEDHGSYLDNCKISNDKIPDSVTSEKGQQLQKRIWEDLVKILESVEPGCVEKVL